MATRRPRKENTVHAVATAKTNSGYGHVTIHIYDLLGYNNGTLKIDCQSGGTCPGETYAWAHGVSHDYSVLGETALKNGLTAMRRIKRGMEKERAEHGSPRNFAEYAVRVLRAAGVRRVHLVPGVNAGYYGDVKTLPALDPLKQGDVLFDNLRLMEEKIISMSSYREAA
jgi:hypothetical protein